jgi:hypothetical protein
MITWSLFLITLLLIVIAANEPLSKTTTKKKEVVSCTDHSWQALLRVRRRLSSVLLAMRHMELPVGDFIVASLFKMKFQY